MVIHDFLHSLKMRWLYMLEAPWHHSDSDATRRYHWEAWLAGWAWVLAGLLLGALIAPSLIEYVGLSESPYQQVLVISLTVLAGFLIQLLGSIVAEFGETLS